MKIVVFSMLVSSVSAFSTFQTFLRPNNLPTPSSIAFPPARSTSAIHRYSWNANILRSKKLPDEDDDKGETWLDRLFQPIINKYAELPESDQSMLASIYQSAYFMLCVYIGVAMVRAYKHTIDQQDGLS